MGHWCEILRMLGQFFMIRLETLFLLVSMNLHIFIIAVLVILGYNILIQTELSQETVNTFLLEELFIKYEWIL